MFRQAPSFAYHDLGIVEDGDTASQAIEKDKFVIWKGSSYFASTDILQGATLEEDVNLTAIPDGVINGVVESLGNNSPQIITNENGTAYKFQSGLMICTKYKNGTFSVSSAWGNLYESSAISIGDWAEQFIATPFVFGSNVSSSERNSTAGWIEYIKDTTATSAGKFHIVRPTTANQPFTFYFVGIGKWK